MNQFTIGQQVWVCAALCGLLHRVKGTITDITDDAIHVFRFDHQSEVRFPLSGMQGEGESKAWLVERL